MFSRALVRSGTDHRVVENSTDYKSGKWLIHLVKKFSGKRQRWGKFGEVGGEEVGEVGEAVHRAEFPVERLHILK